MRKLLTSLLVLPLVILLLGALFARPALAFTAVNPNTAALGAFWDNTPDTHADALQQSTVTKQVTADSYLEYVFRTYVSSGVIQIVGKTDKNGNPIATGAVQVLASGIGTMLQNRPVSAGEYIAYYGDRLKIPGGPQPAYAATVGGGTGFELLKPLVNIWSIARNLAYLFFAIVFIVVGVMIMMRSKIDQKTVISVQTALPKIIVAIILVTFSYAIAGLLIDAMYVLIALILALFGSASGIGGFPDPKFTFKNFQEALWGGQSIFWVWGQLDPIHNVTGPASAIGNGVSVMIDAMFKGTPVLGGISNLLGKLFGTGISALAALIIAIAILWALFKTWFMLLMAYIQIILGVISAPLQLMMDAIPGQNQFGNWLKQMLQNILVFPMVIIMLLLATVLSNNFAQGTGKGSGTFTPPLLGTGGSGTSPDTIPALIGLGILLTMPKALEMLQKAIKAPKLEFGTAWQEPIYKNPIAERQAAISKERERLDVSWQAGTGAQPASAVQQRGLVSRIPQPPGQGLVGT